MAALTLPDVELLRQLFTYDPVTGKFVYLPRPRSLFRSDKHWKAWTSRFENRPAGRLDGDGYVRILINGRAYLAHRLAFKISFGRDPKYAVDHINGVRTDNRLANLREATHAENLRNRGPARDSKLGIKGVCRTRSGRYAAHIQAGGKSINLGHFSTPEEAAVAYQKAAQLHFGEFAWRPTDARHPPLADNPKP